MRGQHYDQNLEIYWKEQIDRLFVLILEHDTLLNQFCKIERYQVFSKAWDVFVMLQQIAQDCQHWSALLFEIFDQDGGEVFSQRHFNFFKLTEGLKYSQRLFALGML